MVDAVATTYQVPRDLPLLAILAILSMAIGGRRRIRVAPDWLEVLSIYAIVAMASGERKSPVMAVLSAPVLAVERDFADGVRPHAAMARALRDLRAAAVEKIKRKGDTSAAAIADLQAAVRELDETVVPAIPRLLVDDSTSEAMARIMAEQGGRLGVLSAEGGLFATLAGRYSSGVPNLDLVLKAWSGDPVRVDRIGRDPIDIAEPVLSMGLAVQPDIIASLAQGKHFRGAGLLARLLYAVPDSMVGNREVSPVPLPEQVQRDYAAGVTRLVCTLYPSDEIDEIKLTGAGLHVLNGFRVDLEPRLHPDGGDLAHIADWANKLPGQLVRIAALFTLFDDPEADRVDGQAIAEVIDLAPYLISHARVAFEMMSGRRSPLEPCRAVLRWITRKGLSTFTVRQARRELAGQVWADSVDAVRDALADLTDLGWVRPVEQSPRRGRPSELYEVHSDVWTKKTN